MKAREAENGFRRTHHDFVRGRSPAGAGWDNFAIQSQPDMTVVAEASNGREAVEMFLRHRADVTLMDLQMPQMNGIEATIEIRRASPAARVLVLTTYSGDIQAMRALEAGAAGLSIKGVDAQGTGTGNPRRARRPTADSA